MNTNIRWNLHRATHHPPPGTDGQFPHCRLPQNQFKLKYTCPNQGFPALTPNTCKKHHTLACCGCKAHFSIFFHNPSASIRVKWHWKHNHNPNSHQEMLNTRAPVVVDEWLKAQVDSGLDWPKNPWID